GRRAGRRKACTGSPRLGVTFQGTAMPPANTEVPELKAGGVSAPPAPFSGSVAATLAARLGIWRALKWAVLLVALLALVGEAASWLVQRDRIRRRLNARLEAAFGRPVEVDRYGFSFWGGPTLEADGVQVGEDPRFGHEYFLRADSLAVRLHW